MKFPRVLRILKGFALVTALGTTSTFTSPTLAATKSQQALNAQKIASFGMKKYAQCSASFEDPIQSLLQRLPLVRLSPKVLSRMKMMLHWEQNYNLQRYRQTNQKVQVKISQVFSDEVIVQRLSGQTVASQIMDGDQVLWLSHPYNFETEINLNRVSTVGEFTAYTTAGRTLVFLEGPLAGYALKAAASHPHGSSRLSQLSKGETADDIRSAVVHSEFFINVDEISTQVPFGHIVLKDELSVSDVESGEGYILRNLSPLMDGSFYLPAFSIPYMAGELYEANKSAYINFLEIHYLKPLAELKAQLLLKYGMQMEFPHPQNILLQLDENMRPTGRLVMRDLSDLHLVRPIAEARGFKTQLEREKSIGYQPQEVIKPFVSKSLFTLLENENFKLSSDESKSLKVIHNKLFLRELSRILKIDFAEVPTSLDELHTLTQWINTQQVQKRLKNLQSRPK